MKIVKSVETFMSAINNFLHLGMSGYIDGSGLKPRLFFRGQERDFQLTNNVASLFRNKNKEGTLINEYRRYFSSELKQMTNNAERLAHMQHYGLNTRLLDITADPLVALYFAVQNSQRSNTKSDGIVYLFQSNSPDSKLPKLFRNSYSDHLEVLATLAFMPEEQKTEVYGELKKFNEFIEKQDLKKVLRIYYNFINGIPGYGDLNSNEILVKLKEEDSVDSANGVFEDKLNAFLRIKQEYEKINHHYAIKALYAAIKRDIGAFNEVIDFNSLMHPFFFESPMSNERLKAQNGFFMFQPFEHDPNCKNNDFSDIISSELIMKNNKKTKGIIRIDGSSKKYILRDLDVRYGINQAKLFPDHSNVADYINNEF